MPGAIDSKALGERLIELLRLGREGTIELQLLRDGSVRALRLQEARP